MTQVEGSTRQRDFKIEILVIFAILISLGFPGNLTEIYGERLGTAMEYGAFAVEIFAMLLSSGSSWLDIQIINLKKMYLPLYLFAAVMFIESMLVTRYPSLQLITCIRLTVTVFFAIWLQERFRFERLIELICTAQALFILAVIGFMLLHPGQPLRAEQPI